MDDSPEITAKLFRCIQVGFTGTQQGMTPSQSSTLDRFIRQLRRDYGKIDFHHGDCIGSDAQAHRAFIDIIRAHLYTDKSILKVTIHPPIIDRKRAHCGWDYILPEKDYIARNHDIVNAVKLMIATPGEFEEQERSGTWATIRYARKKKKPLLIIWPDGTYTIEFKN